MTLASRSLTLVHLIPSRLVRSEIRCMVQNCPFMIGISGRTSKPNCNLATDQ